MRIPPFLALFAAGGALMVHASGWAPIPAEVWAMKEDPAQGILGAVVLEQRMTFTGTAIKHVLRYRVLSERGKAVAELPLFLPESTDIEGRTVQPDGTVTTFDKAKDFSEKTLTIGQSDRRMKVLLPPGLTSDCVVEVRWAEIASGREDQEIPYSLGYSAEWSLGSAFKTQELVVEFWPSFHWAAFVNPGRVKDPQVVREGRKMTYTFHDVPGLEASPYSLEALSGRPSLQVWTQPWFLTRSAQSKPEDYWRDAALQWLKPHFWKDFQKGSAYKVLAAELLASLPADPLKAAETILTRLDRRILNQSWTTLEERARLKKNEGLDTIESSDLDATASRGRTNGAGMAKLFLALTEQAGLHPRLAFVKDRSKALFHYQVPNVHQLQDFLVGIPLDANRTFWMDPALRFAAPGVIIPEYQGVEALVMDLDTWKPRPEIVDALPAEFNTTKFRFKLDLGEDEERVLMVAGFSGDPELRERRRSMAVSPEEAGRLLKERLEKAFGDWNITQAKVTGAWTPDQNTQWGVEASRERMTSRALHINPFPGMASPLWVPTEWPDKRAVPIAMHILSIHDAESVVRLPEGYALQPLPALAKENSFGKVQYSVEVKNEGGFSTARVAFRVELRRLAAPASAEGELREFLGWVQEGYHRRMTLEKP